LNQQKIKFTINKSKERNTFIAEQCISMLITTHGLYPI
jgi:hypothetical protein